MNNLTVVWKKKERKRRKTPWCYIQNIKCVPVQMQKDYTSSAQNPWNPTLLRTLMQFLPTTGFSSPFLQAVKIIFQQTKRK